MKLMMHCFSLYYQLDNERSHNADVAVVACLSRHVNIAPSSPSPGLLRPPPIIVVVIVVARRLSLPPLQIPVARMLQRRLESRGFNTTNNCHAETSLSEEEEQTGIINIDRCPCRCPRQ